MSKVRDWFRKKTAAFVQGFFEGLGASLGIFVFLVILKITGAI